MRTYRGIVCEKHDMHMIFITQNGEFHKGIPLNAKAEIGEEVEFHLATATLFSKKKRTDYNKIAPVILAALLFIFISTSLLLPNKNVAAAIIQLNGDHTIEIGVNEKGEVISIEIASDELGLEDVEGLPIKTALNKVMNKIYKNDEEISISTKYDNKNRQELKNQVEKAVKEVQANKLKTNSESNSNQSNEKLELENSNSANSSEEINQNPTGNQQNNGVNHPPEKSLPNANKKNTVQDGKVNQVIPNQSKKQDKTNPSNENSQNEKQNLQKEQSPKKGNNNQTKNSINKENNPKSEKNNGN